MALTKAQESIEISDNRFIALLITHLPRRFQGGIPICMVLAKTALDRQVRSVGRVHVADHHVIVRTKPASMLASMSVAVLKQTEESHSTSSRRSCTAQPAVIHSECRSSTHGSSSFLRAGRH